MLFADHGPGCPLRGLHRSCQYAWRPSLIYRALLADRCALRRIRVAVDVDSSPVTSGA